MPSQAVNLKIAGLFTNDQYLGEVPPGAMLECLNFNHDRQGILEKRRGYFVYGDTFGSSGDRIKQMFSYKGVVIRHYNDVLQFDDGTGTFTAFSGSYTEPDGDNLRMKAQEMNGNFYFTTDNGIKKISVTSSAELTDTTILDSGAIKALDLKAITDYSSPGFLPPLSKVAYRVAWAYKDANNNTIRGRPSAIAIATNVSETESAVVNVEFPVPEGITSDYFYEIYRSPLVTATSLAGLDDIVPEDELNLVIQDFPSVLSGTISVQDITPDDFRSGGAFLYTNPISGEGISQANDPPPLAKDITLFKSYGFYANTKTKHRFDLNLLSVTDFVSSDTKLIISSGVETDEFTFVGAAAESTVVWATANYSNKSDLRETYFFIVSASDEREYFVWFDDDGTATQPSGGDTTGKLALKVDLSGLGATPTNEEIVDQMIIDFANTLDFSGAKTGSGTDTTLTITNCCNGNTTAYHIDNGSSVPVPAPAGGSVTFNDQTTAGDGEDPALKEILLSSKLTPGQQVEETSQSIVEIVNAQSTGVSFAEYLSSVNDVPGLMNFESRELEDVPFYFAIEETTPGANEKFNPTLPSVKTISGFTPSLTPTTTTTEVTSAAHAYSNGDTVVIYDNVDLNGTYTVSNSMTNTFEINKNTFGLSSGAAKVFLGSVVSDNEEAPNRLYFSKLQQPEAVPIVNFIDIGPKDKPIRRVIGLRDSLYVFKDDGIYRLSGETPNSFVVNLFDGSSVIISPDTAAVLNNKIYVATTQGVIAVSDSGAEIMSKPIENLINDARLNDNFNKYSFAITSETDRAYHMWTTEKKTDTVATQCFRFNSDTGSWTRWDLSQTAGVVNTSDDKIYLGSADQNTIEKERKNRDRTDHADRELSLQLNENGINEKVLTSLSSITDIAVGDVLHQTQYLTVSEYNRILRQIDLDPLINKSMVSITPGLVTTIEITSHGLATGDFVKIEGVGGTGSNLVNGVKQVTVLTSDVFTIAERTAIYTLTTGEAKYSYQTNLNKVAGDNIITATRELAERLQTDIPTTDADSNANTGFFGSGSTFCWDTSSAPATFEATQKVFNEISDRLSDISATAYDNYIKSEGTKVFEELIIEKDTVNNTVTIFSFPTFVVGDLTLYKGIQAEATWVPNHAGDPSVVKMLTSATFLFDNLNFSTATISYATDINQSYNGRRKTAEGIGIFGQTSFGEEGFGGVASSEPLRILLPRNKARCRFISPRIEHGNARERIGIFGTSFTVEVISERGYRGRNIDG